MKLMLVGHRGVGKSSLLRRMSTYVSQAPWVFLSLDEEIEKTSGQSISEIFAQRGENGFRHIENEVFKAIDDRYEDHVVVDIGAGFLGAKPSGWKALWVQRSIDLSSFISLDRPSVSPSGTLQMPKEKYLERQSRYRAMSDFEVELLEHRSETCSFEKLFFQKLLGEGGEDRIQRLGSLYQTVTPLKSPPELLNCGMELRDDWLRLETLKERIESHPTEKVILSFRNFQNFDETKHLLQENIMWDWPSEWGECPFGVPSIHSFHERSIKLEETLDKASQFDGLVKLAVPIVDFSELIMAHHWWRENPRQRVFLPSSPNGRWQWYRLLTLAKMPFSFIRDGEGSAPDQPTWAQIVGYEEQFEKFGAILGSPIKHSLTPWLQGPFFNGHQGNVLSIDMVESEFDSAMPFLLDLGLKWAAVTSPLKNKAREIIGDSPFETINTLEHHGQWTGTNTDIVGLKTLTEGLVDKDVAVWGGGGTLPMIQKVLPNATYYSARTGETRSGEARPPQVILWAVGRSSFEKNGRFPPEEWTPEQVVDLNYTHDSPGIECAHLYGCQYRSGLDMFLSQGKAQQAYWSENVGQSIR